MSNTIQLTVEIGTLSPAETGETRQQYADAIAERLLVYLPSDNITYKIGGAQPTSDEGPWFKEVSDPKSGESSFELWVWSVSAASYVPLTLNQTQLRYYVGDSTPSGSVYDVWFKTNSSGSPLGTFVYNSGAASWVQVSYTRGEVDAFFEGEDSGKKQVDWSRILNVPSNAANVPRSSAAVLTPVDALYDYEQVYHTSCGQLLIYDPVASLWKTVDGGVGDIKEVSGTTIGATSDFLAGNFGTILGKNPGWDLDTASTGRTVVGASASESWDGITPLMKTAGSVFGSDSFVMTVDQLATHKHSMGIGSDNYTGSSGENIEGAKGTERGEQFTANEGASDPISLVQKSIAYYRLRKVL